MGCLDSKPQMVVRRQLSGSREAPPYGVNAVQAGRSNKEALLHARLCSAGLLWNLNSHTPVTIREDSLILSPTQGIKENQVGTSHLAGKQQ